MEERAATRHRAPEDVRRQKRKELDARRSKSRIRLGAHLEQWCNVKDQLGFQLHSDFAKFLLDSYASVSPATCSDTGGTDEDPKFLRTSSAALCQLVVWAHDHSRDCGFIPSLRLVMVEEAGGSFTAVWECLAGHSFLWLPLASTPAPSVRASRSRSRARSRFRAPEPDPALAESGQDAPDPEGCPLDRSIKREAAEAGSDVSEGERSPAAGPGAHRVRSQPPPRETGGLCRQTAAAVAGTGADNGRETDGEGEPRPGARDAAGRLAPVPGPLETERTDGVREERDDQNKRLDDCEGTEETTDDDLSYADDLKDENYSPSSDSSERTRRKLQPRLRGRPPKESPSDENPPGELKKARRSPRAQDEELVTKISSERTRRKLQPRLRGRPPKESPSDEKLPGELKKARRSPRDQGEEPMKKIRKKPPKEILRCEYEGCGKIVSNRQYLKHHMKYQHLLQKTFACSHPSCRRSFNFKKHLKEHEKLHSDKRDYICEFCARAFRTTSNLIIHRRIHTGEKPLQCEICGFTCRQKASLNWHMKKHDAESGYQFSCDVCGKRFEKKDNVNAHKSKSHPESPLPLGTAVSRTLPAAEPPQDSPPLELKPEPPADSTPV